MYGCYLELPVQWHTCTVRVHVCSSIGGPHLSPAHNKRISYLTVLKLSAGLFYEQKEKKMRRGKGGLSRKGRENRDKKKEESA